MASPGALEALLAALQAEQGRRARMRGQALELTREAFYKQLDDMAARRRAAPGYVEPSPEKRAAMRRDLDRYFARRARTLS
jgi:hypothetical protein